MNLETIIGLEIHIELKTDTKIFSSSPSHFGAEPNENTNAYDWAHPGVLPRLNKKAVDYGLRASLALNMDIHQDSWFDRKNYYYPDMPLGYQISQMPYPIGHDGYVETLHYNGHEYVIFVKYDGGLSAVHSPDCPCLTK